MRTIARAGVPLAVLGLSLLAAPLSGIAAASTASAKAASYEVTLNPLNNSTASGTFLMSLSGSTATITEHVTGLPAVWDGSPYPHLQHIHIGAQGTCPTAAADKSGDGVVSTDEGAGNFGVIGTTLSTSGDTSPRASATLTAAPTGGSFTYSRTITLDSATLASVQAGKAVVVVLGLDPTRVSSAARSEKGELVPTLALPATAPALCGPLTTTQMGAVPAGSGPTGGGSTAGVEDKTLFVLGGALLFASAGVFAARRRIVRQS
jgi:hypothetical protein